MFPISCSNSLSYDCFPLDVWQKIFSFLPKEQAALPLQINTHLYQAFTASLTGESYWEERRKEEFPNSFFKVQGRWVEYRSCRMLENHIRVGQYVKSILNLKRKPNCTHCIDHVIYTESGESYATLLDCKNKELNQFTIPLIEEQRASAEWMTKVGKKVYIYFQKQNASCGIIQQIDLTSKKVKDIRWIEEGIFYPLFHQDHLYVIGNAWQSIHSYFSQELKDKKILLQCLNHEWIAAFSIDQKTDLLYALIVDSFPACGKKNVIGVCVFDLKAEKEISKIEFNRDPIYFDHLQVVNRSFLIINTLTGRLEKWEIDHKEKNIHFLFVIQLNKYPNHFLSVHHFSLQGDYIFIETNHGILSVYHYESGNELLTMKANGENEIINILQMFTSLGCVIQVVRRKPFSMNEIPLGMQFSPCFDQYAIEVLDFTEGWQS